MRTPRSLISTQVRGTRSDVEFNVYVAAQPEFSPFLLRTTTYLQVLFCSTTLLFRRARPPLPSLAANVSS
ncbi:uncharacterized protein BJ212DRAFT_1418081 [Suillus subaureus]|uniref:Uncharacterized protein n=1 Tax=Suillus subaureus TaxID=48587 RepID=A0A9P7ALQ8_9AGAM|nr:uncharacterized protein BJ212DRAFT_1418081 [Suillus subaureus]KAG1791955.1 hypothetical protein BJ212DRAFT_1418081 [Suillus subaureus]